MNMVSAFTKTYPQWKRDTRENRAHQCLQTFAG